MLTDTTLRSAVEALWDKLWAGGLANPLDAIEQLSFLLFLKRLDEREQDAERAAKLRGKKFTPIFLEPRSPLVSLDPTSGRQSAKARQGGRLSLHQDARRRWRLLGGPDGKRRVQDQQAKFAHRGLQGHRRHADLGAEPGRTGRPLRVPAQQAQHRWPERS